MAKLKNKLILSLLIASIGLTGFSFIVGNKNSNKDNDESSSSTSGKLQVLNANVDTSKFNRLDQIKAEYLLENQGYSETDIVNVIVELDGEALIDDYLEDSKNIDTIGDYADSKFGMNASMNINKEQSAIIKKLVKDGLIENVEHQYKTIINGFSASITYGNLTKLENYKGIKNVILQETYNKPQTTSTDTIGGPVQNVVDVYETGIFNSSTVSYDGEGTAVAILDSGFDCSHEVFRNQPNSGPISQAFIDSVLSDSNAAMMTRDVKVSDVWYSKKIPFVYDYADKDSDVTPYDSEHGTHVAGIIGGYSQDVNADGITGVAINTQLVLMKVFPNLNSGAETDDILAALEDAVLLQVDAINMSLGSTCGFSREKDGDAINVVYDKINESGINLLCAASNSYSSSFGSEQGNTNKVTNPDSATVGSPSTYAAALSVASIDGVKSKYIIGNGEQVIFFDESNDLAGKPHDFFESLKLPETGKVEYEYVTVPGVGLKINYAGIDVKGKIALVRRGDNTFEEKARIAHSEGAAGIIIYNNVAGDILMSMGKNLEIPCVSISKDAGTELAKKSSGTLTMSRENLAGPFMSDFSSWGPTPDLKMKPEITAHGGNIKSAIPGGGYDELSGTSMATPNLCGIVVLIRDYVKDTYPNLNAKEVSVMVNQLLMSTATIALNEEGIPYSPRKQGAGLASLFNAVNSAAYITVDGIDRSKLELGDDPSKKGKYDMKFNIVNTTDKALTYEFDLVGMTETVSSSDSDFVAEKDQILNGTTAVEVGVGGTKNETDGKVTITVNPNATCKVSVNYTLSNEDKDMINSLFPNGMFVEGFVKLVNTGTQETDIDLNVPFLAFFGDWNQAPMFDKTYFEVETEAHDDSIDYEDKLKADVYATTPYASYYNNYILPMGTYLYDIDTSLYDPIPASEEHAAISTMFGAADGISCIYAGMLRGAKTMTFTITDKVTGEVVYEKVASNANKSYSNGGSPYPYYEDIQNKSSQLGLINNREYEFKMVGELDYGDGGLETNLNNTFSFTFTCDDQAPIISNAKFEKKYDKTLKKDRYYVYLDVYDNHYVQAITPISFTSTSSYAALTDNPIPVYGEKNSTTQVKFEITDYIDALYNDAVTTSSLAFIVEDYALNSNLFLVELPGTDGDLKFTEDGTFDGAPANAITVYLGESTDLIQYLATNDENLDEDKSYLKYLTWTSSNEKIAVVKEGIIQPLKAGRVQITAMEGIDARKASIIVNIKERPKETVNANNVRRAKDPIKNEDVKLENLEFSYFETTHAFLSAGDISEIGDTGSIHYFSESPNISFYPGEKVKINYTITPWYLEESRYELEWKSSNPEVATVDQNGNVEAMKKGSATISLTITVDGKQSNIIASTRINVKSEFVIENRVLVAYKGRGGEVVIPDDEGILYIGSFAFCLYELDNNIIIGEDDYDANKVPSSNLTVTSVTVPEGVEEIQKYAFYNCEGLEEVKLPKSIKWVREYSFYGDKKLETINLEDVSVIGARAFKDCVKLDNIDLSNIYALGVRAFEGCTSLSSVDVSTLRNSGKEVFKDCTALKTVKLSKDTKLSYAMFVNSGIENLTLAVDRIPEFAFANCSNLKTVKIENDLIYVGEGAFSGDTSLTKVEFLGKLEWMYSQAFYNCPSLEEVTLPNSSVKYGDYIFYQCSKLKTIKLGKESYIESLGGSIFEDTIVDTFIVDEQSPYYKASSDGSLLLSKDGKELVLASTNFDYPDVLVLDYDVIAQGAFSGVKTLKAIEFTKSTTIVDDYAFANCSSIEEITIPVGGLNLGTYSFSYTTGLTKINNIEELKIISNYAFAGTGLKSVVIADETVLYEGAFIRSSLEEVTLGKNVRLGFGAFEYCENLVTVNMPSEGGVHIGRAAFANDTKLKNIDLIKIDAELENEAFFNCTSLAVADLQTVTSIGDYAFADCAMLHTVNMPKVVSIGEGAFSRATENGSAPVISVVSLPSTLENLGDGAFMGAAGFSEIVIPEGITNIPDFSFAYCIGLTKVVLPNSVDSIGQYAFAGCGALEKINTKNVEIFGDYSFSTTEGLKEIDLSSAKVIGDYAFINSTIAEIGSTSNITTIGEYAFQANYFTSFDASNVSSIKEGAFNSNQQLLKFIISDKLEFIDYAVFLGCSNLEKFVSLKDGKEVGTINLNDKVFLHEGSIYTYLPNGSIELNAYPGGNRNKEFAVLEGTVRIEEYAGNMNTNLEKVILPDSLKTIGNFAFNGCTSLNTVEFKSFIAPKLESNYGFTTSEDPYLSETDPGYELLSKYYNLFNDVYFYAQFIDLVGKKAPIKMILPQNDGVVGYDSLIYEAYFGKVKDAERSDYIARDENTVNFLDAFKLVPTDVNKIKLSDEKVIVNALTLLNSLKQDLTKYGYTQEEVNQMKKIVVDANQKLRDLKFASATKEVKEIQTLIDNLPATFDSTNLSSLVSLSSRINRLELTDRQLLDLTKYNQIVASYESYVSTLQNEVTSSKDVSSKTYDYSMVAASVALFSLMSLLVVALKKFAL